MSRLRGRSIPATAFKSDLSAGEGLAIPVHMAMQRAPERDRRDEPGDDSHWFYSSIHQIDVKDRQFEDVRAAAFFNFQEQHGDEFFAHINFE